MQSNKAGYFKMVCINGQARGTHMKAQRIIFSNNSPENLEETTN
jgi:hypothetical protein